MSQRPVGTSTAGLVLVDDLADRLPDGLFVLVLPGDDGRGGVEMWVRPRGERVVLAFSSIQALVGACGAGQRHHRWRAGWCAHRSGRRFRIRPSRDRGSGCPGGFGGAKFATEIVQGFSNAVSAK